MKAAIPAIDPAMSNVYARSGGIDLSSPPSGTARPAMSSATSATSAGRTRKLMSAALDSR